MELLNRKCLSKIFREIEEKGEIHSGPVFGEILGIRKETIEAGSHHGTEMAAANKSIIWVFSQ